jgi:hypothetical protein
MPSGFSQVHLCQRITETIVHGEIFLQARSELLLGCA